MRASKIMNIADKVYKLVKRYKTNNPFELCQEIGIEVVYADLGALKGMYTCIKRNRFVVINENLDCDMRKIVCAHELAHDQLHRNMSTSSWMKDFNLFNFSSKPEYEANAFASQLLVDEAYLLELIKEEKTVDQISKLMCLDPNLICIKVKFMIEKGVKLTPQYYDSRFLKYDRS